MNKKLVAFALSTTALLGAGAMVETTPFSGVAASTAYAYEAPEGVTSVYMRSYGGTGLAQLYSNGTLVMSGGTAASMDFRREIRMATMQFADGIDVVFENSPVLEGSAEDLMSNLAVRSVSGGLVVRGSLADMFGGNETVETVDLTLLEGSEVTNLSRMFRDCTKLTSVALSGWENVAVENMASMFEGCSALTTINVSEWKTDSVTDMSYLFYECSSLTSLDLSAWDVSSVTGMGGMFGDCTSLTGVVTTGWDTKSVKYLEYLFGGCTALASADLSSFDTTSLRTATQIFSGCTSLATVDVSGWTFYEAREITGMFENCTALTAIDFTGWNVFPTVETDGMFAGAEKVSQLTLGDTTSIDFLSGLSSSEDWVLSSDRALGEFTLANLVSGWNDETMAGTWYTASTLPAPAVTPVSVYRLYNPNSGEHFYTLSEVERDATVAAGWNDEGIGWYAPDSSDKPVYRLYSGTDHHYTMDEDEKAALIEEGWVDEGVAFYSADPEDGIALLRQFNPFVDPDAATNNSGSHNYTTDQVENDYLVSLGWQAEDVAFYGMAVEYVEA